MTNKTDGKRRVGRPALRVDPEMIAPGLVDTHTPPRFLSGDALERRRMWERDRRRRQMNAARNRVNAPSADTGDDLLVRYHKAQGEIRLLSDLLSGAEREIRELKSQARSEDNTTRPVVNSIPGLPPLKLKGRRA